MTVPVANGFQERVSQPASAVAQSGNRFWVRLEHDFAHDAAFVEAADCCGTSPAICQSIALQLRIRENEGRRLGPADLDSLAWFCRVPADLVRRIIETLIKLGRIATAVLRAITRDRSPGRLPGDHLARHRAAQRRYRASKRADRRQLCLLLPIGSSGDHAPITSDHASITPDHSRSPRSPESNEINSAAPPIDRSPPDHHPITLLEQTPIEEKSQSTEASLVSDKEDEVSRRCAPSPAAPAPDNGKARKRANLLKTLGRWVRHSPAVEHGERLGHLDLLARAELALHDWWARPIADQRALEALVARMKHAPLPPEIVTAIYQAERGRAPNHGFEAMTAKLGWFHGGRRDGRAA